jgi:osmoprotectant transport system permease protein
VNADSFIWWDWVGRHTDDIKEATWEHLRLTLIAVVIGFAISMVLSVLALRWRVARLLVTSFSGVLYTIPSLALFAFFVSITGFSTLTAEIGLVSYTLLILIRNILEGLEGVPPSVREAADGMGFGPTRRFVGVELPLALPAIFAGLRIATVTTVGLVTVTGLIGMGGYGSFIDSGLSRLFSTEVVVGAGLSVIMALVLDGLLVGLEWLMTPWRHRSSRGSARVTPSVAWQREAPMVAP